MIIVKEAASLVDEIRSVWGIVGPISDRFLAVAGHIWHMLTDMNVSFIREINKLKEELKTTDPEVNLFNLISILMYLRGRFEKYKSKEPDKFDIIKVAFGMAYFECLGFTEERINKLYMDG